MNGSVSEWIEKAEEDFQMALLGIRQRKHPVYDGVCFHAQQCAEKYLKAFLVHHAIKFHKTHDLDELQRLCAPVDASFNLIADLFSNLNPYSIDIRYPGPLATKDEARDAVAAMKQVRKFVRAQLGLKP